MATGIKKKPTTHVTKLAIQRVKVGTNTRVMRATWAVPAAATNTKSNARATKIRYAWHFTKKNAKAKSSPTHTVDAGIAVKQADKAINGLWGKVTYTRDSFYPVTSWKVKSCWLNIRLGNKKGWGKKMSSTYKFAVPRKPTLGDWTFNNETGMASINIKTDAGTDKYERYDTRYTLHVVNTRTNFDGTTKDRTSTSLDFNQTYNVSDYQQLSYEEYVKLTLTAWARGFAGDSAIVTKTIYVSYPSQATISKSIVSSKTTDGKCTIYIKTNSTTEHPVDRVKLEYLANVPYSDESQISADADWKDAGIMDDAKCSALAVGVSELIPEAGKYTWVRVKSYHLNEDVLYVYSKPHRVTGLETPAPTAEDDEITLVSARPGSDGRSAVITLGWNKEGLDDSTGTELSWSDEIDTWKSTKEPDTYRFTWSDGPLTVEIDGQEVSFRDSATITIKGLGEGEKYYVKARRYLEGDVESYSEYTDTATVVTSERPETIVATCDRYLNDGMPLTVRWTFSGNGIQREWQIVQTSVKYLPTQTEGVVAGKTYYRRSGVEGAYEYTEVENPVSADLASYFEASTGAVIASGETSVGSTQIAYDRLQSFAENDNVAFAVQASTGSGWVTSSVLQVGLIDSPTLEIEAPEVLTRQPITFTANSNRACDLTVILTSNGISGQFPQGTLYQIEGDTVHSDIYPAEWAEAEEGFTASVTLPDNLDLWDTGRYTLKVSATDRGTGLESEPQTAEVTIAWAHQAPNPTEYVTVTPIDMTDEDGVHHIAAQIDLTPPAESAETDSYDIYRMDGGNAQLIGADFPLTASTVDEYAPFSGSDDLYYRVAIRTEDGDVDFTDIQYTAEFKALRLDWAEGYLELPYGISVGDSYKKDVSIRKHLDGTIDGYWNPGVERKGSLSTSVIKIVQPDDIEKARLLARYAGPVFVRTPNGSAYAAHVDVTDLSVKNKAVTAISLDCTEIRLTDEFQLPPYEIEEE